MGLFRKPKMLSITTSQFLSILFPSSPHRAVKAKAIGLFYGHSEYRSAMSENP